MPKQTDIGRKKARLDRFARLVDLYGQSRVLPLIIPLVLLAVAVAILLGAFGLSHHVLTTTRWSGTTRVVASLAILALGVVWTFFSCFWLQFKLMARYGPGFYRKEGQIDLKSERIPIWAWVVYAITFVGPAVLCEETLFEEALLSIPWALTIAFASFGIFLIYIGKKHKEIVLGIVFGGLAVLEAVAAGIGLLPIFPGSWQHAYFLTLMAYLLADGLITIIVVHLYNRAILRRIKGASPLGSQQSDIPDGDDNGGQNHHDKNVEKQKAKLDRFARLIDLYGQSRVLPLLIPLAILILNAIVLLASGKVAELLIFHLQISEYWFEVIVVGAILWVLFSSTWVVGKLLGRYGGYFYKKEGIIELREEKIPIWAWAAYCITFVGPTVLSLFEIMPVRWALVMALASFGTFMLYAGKKQKEKVLGLVFGGLCLIAATATAMGIRTPFASKIWPYSFFVALMIYIVAAALITVVVVHIYNRRILRRIKEMRLLREQEADRSDT